MAKGSALNGIMPMKYNLPVFVVIIFCALPVPEMRAQTQQIKFKHLGLENGLSFPAVRTILKDSRGFIWMGTSSGLNRFDGYTIRSFFHDPRDSSTLIDDGISQMFEAPDGTLLVQTSSGF